MQNVEVQRLGQFFGGNPSWLRNSCVVICFLGRKGNGSLNPSMFGYFGDGKTPVFISRIHTAYMTVRIPPFLVHEMFGDAGYSLSK